MPRDVQRNKALRGLRIPEAELGNERERRPPALLNAKQTNKKQPPPKKKKNKQLNKQKPPNSQNVAAAVLLLVCRASLPAGLVLTRWDLLEKRALVMLKLFPM